MAVKSEGTVRVLIVDDQAPFRDAARAVVELTDGFEVVGEADSGEASVELAERLRPDMILMDVNLPGIDGFEATRQIRERLPEAVVVIVSTYEREVFGSRVDEAGANGYVAKSAFSPDTLESAWAEAIAS